jgi:hypothetical protein
MDFTLNGVLCPLGDSYRYDAKVQITVLPTDTLADFIELEKQFRSHEGETLTVEQLAAALHKDIKTFYGSDKGYTAKAEVIVSTEQGIHFPVRVHIAG